MKRVLILLLIVFENTISVKAQKTILAVDWPSFMRKHDLIWDSLSTDWGTSAFLGNGLLGAMIYKADSNSLRWDIGRSDVTDHREGFTNEFGKARLPIGHFLLKPVGKIKQATMRLDLWNAEAKGLITTDKGTIKWRSLVHANDLIILTEIETTGNETNFKWQWVGELSVSPRSKFKPIPTGYEPNPPYQMSKHGDVQLCSQPLMVGGGYSTAWAEQKIGQKRKLYISVGSSFPENTSESQALEAVNNAIRTNYSKLIQSHRLWWHNYYPASFVSLPDKRLESFYWIQQYKLAAATRQDRPAVDVLGPWFIHTPWPAFWWNLNVQLTYYPVYTSNRLHLGESLIRMIDKNVDNLINNVPEAYRYNSAGIGRVSSYDCKSNLDIENPKNEGQRELGNLLWVLHNYWLHYRYSMDEQLLRNGLYPLLKRGTNYYIHLLKKGADGKLHLPTTVSPEYGRAADSNYDLSLLRWSCQILLESSHKLGLNDTLEPKWKNILANLTPYPTDQNGLIIGHNVPYTQSHRHYSHLLMIYPLATLNWDQAENRPLMEKSFNQWKSLNQSWRGFSFTGAASLLAQMQKGDEALLQINKLLDTWILPNTFYREDGPVIETPLSVVTSVNDMLLQSWGDQIRVFPAVPSEWQDITFHQLRAEGAFLVSAQRKMGKTSFIQLTSLKGKPCLLTTDIPREQLCISSKRKLDITWHKSQILKLDLKSGETATIFTKADKESFILNPVTHTKQKHYYYGFNKIK